MRGRELIPRGSQGHAGCPPALLDRLTLPGRLPAFPRLPPHPPAAGPSPSTSTSYAALWRWWRATGARQRWGRHGAAGPTACCLFCLSSIHPPPPPPPPPPAPGAQVKLEKTRLEAAGEGKDQKAIGTGALRRCCGGRRGGGSALMTSAGGRRPTAGVQAAAATAPQWEVEMLDCLASLNGRCAAWLLSHPSRFQHPACLPCPSAQASLRRFPQTWSLSPSGSRAWASLGWRLMPAPA